MSNHGGNEPFSFMYEQFLALQKHPQILKRALVHFEKKKTYAAVIDSIQDVLSLNCSILNQGTFAQIFLSVAGYCCRLFWKQKRTSRPALTLCLDIILSLVSLLLPLIINRSAAYEPKRIFTLQPFHFHGCPRKGLFTPSQLHSVTSLAVQAFAMLKAMAADSIAVVNAASLVPSIYILQKKKHDEIKTFRSFTLWTGP